MKKVVYFLIFNSTLLFACNRQAKNKFECNGTISGHIVALEGFIDSGTIVCAVDTLSHQVYSFEKWTNGDKFQLSVPEGIYFVYEEHSCEDVKHKEFRCKGYYTEYMKLGLYLKDGNASHKPIAIKVICNKEVNNIVVGDYWGQ
jgi:hypothetical protein